MWAWACKENRKWADTDEAEGVGVDPALGQRDLRLPRLQQIGLGMVTDPRRPRLVKRMLLIQGRRMAKIMSFFAVCPSFDGFETIPEKQKKCVK